MLLCNFELGNDIYSMTQSHIHILCKKVYSAMERLLNQFIFRNKLFLYFASNIWPWISQIVYNVRWSTNDYCIYTLPRATKDTNSAKTGKTGDWGDLGIGGLIICVPFWLLHNLRNPPKVWTFLIVPGKVNRVRFCYLMETIDKLSLIYNH